MLSYPNKTVMLGSIPVARALPARERRMVGPWCFVDRFGPMTFADGKPMDVAPHPHIGLQTVTWLLDGEIQHDDSLGCATVTRPGGVSVMTSGGGIAHTEQTPPENTHRLDGVQLWVALPDAARNGAAAFSANPHVPVIDRPSGPVRVFSGTLEGVSSPAPHHSPILGADLEIRAGQTLAIPLDPEWEHAVLILHGSALLDGAELAPGQLHYLETGRAGAEFASAAGGRILLIGGPPFPEKILMWWNFVARTPEEITAAREDWEHRRRFADVKAYRGPRLDAPPLSPLTRLIR